MTLFVLQSCIPTRIAPNIKDYKVTKGKRFKRSLPERNMFVFEDSKDAGQFYNYVNTKFKLDNENVFDDVPFVIDNNQYFFSFYEVEIPSKIFNLGGVVADGLLTQAGLAPAFGSAYGFRKGHWYIAIETYSDEENDCLETMASSRDVVLLYLRKLKQEYTTTYNYNETVFKN